MLNNQPFSALQQRMLAKGWQPLSTFELDDWIARTHDDVALFGSDPHRTPEVSGSLAMAAELLRELPQLGWRTAMTGLEHSEAVGSCFGVFHSPATLVFTQGKLRGTLSDIRPQADLLNLMRPLAERRIPPEFA